MAIKIRPDNKAWQMTNLPNIRILPHPHNPEEEKDYDLTDPLDSFQKQIEDSYDIELPRDSETKLRNLEEELTKTLGKGSPARATLVLDTRPTFKNIEDAEHDKLSKALYSRNRRYGGPLIPLYVSKNKLMEFPADYVSRAIGATDILKKLTDSRPNRREFQALKSQLPRLLSSNPEIAKKFTEFAQQNRLSPTIGIGDLLSYHIFNRLKYIPKDRHIEGLHEFLSSASRQSHRNPYHTHINQLLSAAIQRHLTNRRK